jgi:hypothetical protein
LAGVVKAASFRAERTGIASLKALVRNSDALGSQAPDGHVLLLDAVQDQDQGGDHSVEQLEVLCLQERLDF